MCDDLVSHLNPLMELRKCWLEPRTIRAESAKVKWNSSGIETVGHITSRCSLIDIITMTSIDKEWKYTSKMNSFVGQFNRFVAANKWKVARGRKLFRHAHLKCVWKPWRKRNVRFTMKYRSIWQTELVYVNSSILFIFEVRRVSYKYTLCD